MCHLQLSTNVPNNSQNSIGIDNVTLTPEDINGNTGATELAPEESDDVLEPPSSFPYALEFLGKPREESIKEFVEAFSNQINPQMIKKAESINPLKEKGQKVFVPTNWEGINDLDPLELDFDEEKLPRLIKPRLRPINPRLYENAFTEFKRLFGYFYRKSTSPHRLLPGNCSESHSSLYPL